MSILHLILREIQHHKLRFALGVLAVLAAVGSVTAACTLLKHHDMRTEEIVAERESELDGKMDELDDIVARKERDLKEKMDQLEDESRKITKDMGFNLQIVPKGQVLDPYAPDFALLEMPVEYAQRFVNAKPRIVSVNHVLPILEKRLTWTVGRKTKTVFVVGIADEVYVQDRRQAPLLDPVPPTELVIAKELAEELNLSRGQPVELLNEKFTIRQLLPARDDKDRNTVWMNLATAQELLGKPGKINGILALECGCDADRLSRIEKEVGTLLPDTVVYQFTSKANTRADVRNLAAQTARAALDQEKEARARLQSTASETLDQERQSRAMLRRQREDLIDVLIPIVLVVSALWIAVLTFGAVRERRVEIAILRALGLRGWQILTLFLGSALLMGLLGSLLGFGLGAGIGSLFHEQGQHFAFGPLAFNLMLLVILVVAAPLLACLAAWLPALLAARQDPAQILCEE